MIDGNTTQETQELSNSNDDNSKDTPEINDNSSITQENEDNKDIESSNESNTIKIESSYNPESDTNNISGEYITDFINELAYSVPANYIASEYNDDGLKMYSDEEYYNSAHFMTTSTSLYSSVDEYINSSVIYEGMKGQINFVVADINGREWTIVEVLKEYGSEYHYVTIHNDTIYKFDYTISDVPDTKDYNELVMIQNSLVFK